MSKSKIGIWGFGAVGKAALTYLAAQGNQCIITDKRTLIESEHSLLAQHQASYMPQEQLDTFFAAVDAICASPGIDINPYKDRAHFICELDLFVPAWHKPLVAITGTIGKTSTTTLLAQTLQQTLRVAVGGNIGIPMLTLLEQQATCDLAVLELSSWQLEHALPFSPDIAVCTNFFPNHLDRHITMQAYFQAKLRIFLHQTATQTAILPLSLYERIAPLGLAARKIWIDDTNGICMPLLGQNESLLHIKDDAILLTSSTETLFLAHVSALTSGTYLHNALCTLAVLHVLHLPTECIAHTHIAVEHRLEKVGTHNTITFYNDSKATVSESTCAALAQFSNASSITLFLGGISKGVDRSNFIKTLAHRKNLNIVCFGKEAAQLQSFCTHSGITCASFDTLDQAFAHAVQHAQPEEILLFSPAGASHDLYTDYCARGAHFKSLVAAYQNS